MFRPEERISGDQSDGVTIRVLLGFSDDRAHFVGQLARPLISGWPIDRALDNCRSCRAWASLQVQPPEHLPKPRIVAQRIPHRIDSGSDRGRSPASSPRDQPDERLVTVSKKRVDGRKVQSRNVGSRSENVANSFNAPSASAAGRPPPGSDRACGPPILPNWADASRASERAR